MAVHFIFNSKTPPPQENFSLKTLKRQMYGRAGLDLLARRFLLSS